MRGIQLIALGLAAASVSASGKAYTPREAGYAQIVRKTAQMVSDQTAVSLVQRHGMNVLDLTWEDTGRYKNSCVGPNISDMTIQVQYRDGNALQLACMPVIRFPNFSDKTGDIAPEKFFLLVGNEKGESLRRVSLRDFLDNLRAFLHDADSWDGAAKSLLAKRDTHVLVSAQACFLPIPKSGTAEFNPVLFNYQSVGDDPAVLTILVTREGASVTVIDNKRDRFDAGYTWGQRLFFNQNGERASLSGKRMSEYIADKEAQSGGAYREDQREGLNMVLLIQVPLKQRRRVKQEMLYSMPAPCAESAGMSAAKKCESRSDVENAVISHGEAEGPFTEIDGLPIERDPRYPIRVTVQFYKATSNGVVSEEDVRQIADQIDKVYSKADYVGSLVVQGETGRTTEYDGNKVEPRYWWNNFWTRHRWNMTDTLDQGQFWGLE